MRKMKCLLDSAHLSGVLEDYKVIKSTFHLDKCVQECRDYDVQEGPLMTKL